MTEVAFLIPLGCVGCACWADRNDSKPWGDRLWGERRETGNTPNACCCTGAAKLHEKRAWKTQKQKTQPFLGLEIISTTLKHWNTSSTGSPQAGSHCYNVQVFWQYQKASPSWWKGGGWSLLHKWGSRSWGRWRRLPKNAQETCDQGGELNPDHEF